MSADRLIDRISDLTGSYMSSVPDYYLVDSSVTIDTSNSIFEQIINLDEDSRERVANNLVIFILAEIIHDSILECSDIIERHVGKLKLLGFLNFGTSRLPELFDEVEYTLADSFTSSTIVGLRALKTRALEMVGMSDESVSSADYLLSCTEYSEQNIQSLFESLFSDIRQLPALISMFIENIDEEKYKIRRHMLFAVLAMMYQQRILDVEHISILAGRDEAFMEDFMVILRPMIYEAI